MKKEKRRKLFGLVWAYTRILTITGGLLTGAFTMAGYVLMTADKISYAKSASGSGKLITPNRDSFQTVSLYYQNEKLDNESNNNNIIAESNIGITQQKSEQNILKMKVPVRSIEKKSGENFLENFKAECQNGFIRVSWMTEDSEDKQYSVESSGDNENFHAIELTPIITSIENKNYFHNLIPSTEAEQTFFRLKQLSSGKKPLYSEVVQVDCNDSVQPGYKIDVYPEGSGSYKVVVNSTSDDHFQIALTDMNELELVVDEFDVEPGVNEFIFKSGRMPRGHYNLKVTNGTVMQQKKVAIK